MATARFSERDLANIKGDIVFVNPSKLKAMIDQGVWNVNQAVSGPHGIQTNSLIWFAAHFSEPWSLRLLLSVNHPSRRATKQTLENGLRDSNPNDECESLIKEAILVREMEEDQRSASRERASVERELEELKRKQAAIEAKNGSLKSRYQRLYDAAQNQLQTTHTSIARLDARIGTLTSDLKERNQDKLRADDEVKSALRTYTEAEKVLQLAKQNLEKANDKAREVQRDVEGIQSKYDSAKEAAAEASEAIIALTAKCKGIWTQLEALKSSQTTTPERETRTKTESNADAFVCAICQDEKISRVFQCGHPACKTCSDVLVQTSKQCHICRARIRTVGPLFVDI